MMVRDFGVKHKFVEFSLASPKQAIGKIRPEASLPALDVNN